MESAVNSFKNMKIKELYPSLFFRNGLQLLLFILPFTGAAQVPLNNEVYQVWLGGLHERRLASGYLWGLTDSIIALSESPLWTDASLRVYPVEQVQWAKFRERRSIFRGMGQGALCGFAAGFVYGLLQGSDPPCKKNEWICLRLDAYQKGLLYSIITTPTGAIIGGAVGSFKTKITIGGSRSEYARQRVQLEKYRLRQ